MSPRRYPREMTACVSSVVVVVAVVVVVVVLPVPSIAVDERNVLEPESLVFYETTPSMNRHKPKSREVSSSSSSTCSEIPLDERRRACWLSFLCAPGEASRGKRL